MSRYSMTSSKLCPVSTCITGKGKLPGRKALTARCKRTAESFPPENKRTGLRHSAATSRIIVIASSSSSATLCLISAGVAWVPLSIIVMTFLSTLPLHSSWHSSLRVIRIRFFLAPTSGRRAYLHQEQPAECMASIRLMGSRVQ